MIHPLATPVKHNQPRPYRGHHARSSSRHHCEDRDRQSHSRSQSQYLQTLQLYVIMTHTEATPVHQHRDNHGHPRSSSLHGHVPHIEITVINPTATHHTEPHCRSSTHRSSSAYHPRDCSRIMFTSILQILKAEIHKGHIHIPADHKARPHPKKEPESENRRSIYGLLQF